MQCSKIQVKKLGVVHRGGTWTGSTEVVHGPGPHGWSMDPGSMFCIRPWRGEPSQVTLLKISGTTV